MKELIIHPSFIKVTDANGTFARASKLEDGMWSVRTHRGGDYTKMTEAGAHLAMQTAAILVTLS